MLSENIKSIRKSKGLSQEELGIKLNVVRQTISKWEQGLSVLNSNPCVRL
ncbi:Helix-turn-helix domain-containing protein [Eubacterium barkeri]|uniref:Helix-turn-helix domain-containing protein n=1 Tax=Eubacterium barkeri TaxID=1528 RepID=A0A1H3K2H6_EUBBA|nr:Helix-turn-helix domain-containing protein [Eubacterium barkeri]